MRDGIQELEERINKLMVQLIEPPSPRETGRQVETGYWEDIPESNALNPRNFRGQRWVHTGYAPEIIKDYSHRKSAQRQLVEIGKPAIPSLVAVLISEKGEYPDELSCINEGVMPVLYEIGDEDISKSLVEPFEQKVRKVAELRRPNVNAFSTSYYDYQIWSIAHLWKAYPISEAIPALKNAIREKVEHDPCDDESHLKAAFSLGGHKREAEERKRIQQTKWDGYLFGEYKRGTFFDVLCSIGTEEAMSTLFQLVAEDKENAPFFNHYCYGLNNINLHFRLAKEALAETQEAPNLLHFHQETEDTLIKKLTATAIVYQYQNAAEKRQKRKQIGKVLYTIFTSTRDSEIRELSSSALGYAKIGHWLGKVFSS